MQIDDITGVILAGGLARRMGGIDKGLIPLNGKSMVEHIINAISPQVGTLVIRITSYNVCYTKLLRVRNACNHPGYGWH